MTGELRQGAEGHGRGPVGDRQDPDQGARRQRQGPDGQGRADGRDELRRRTTPGPARSSTTRSAGARRWPSTWARWCPASRRAWSGSTQGSRVLIAMPGSDGYDAAGGNPQIDVKVGDTLVFVVDIVAVPLDGPEGTRRSTQGRVCRRSPTRAAMPEITIPKSDPPADTAGPAADQGQGQEGRRDRHDHLRLPVGALERRQDARGDLRHRARPRSPLSESAARHGQGPDRPDGRQPGAAGHPAVRGLPRGQRDARRSRQARDHW